MKDLTVTQVAEDLGLHYDTVRRLLIAGHLIGYKADLKQWRVTHAAINRFKASGGVKRPGRPKESNNTKRDRSRKAARQSVQFILDAVVMIKHTKTSLPLMFSRD